MLYSRMTRRNPPENLNDMLFGIGIPIEHSYGYDHTPNLPSDKDAWTTYQEARRTLLASVGCLAGPQLLAALAFWQRSGGTPGGPEPGLAELEFAQALLLTGSPIQGSCSLDDLTRFREALRLEMMLFLEHAARAPQNARDDLIRRRQRDTLHVRHTLYPAEARAVHRAVAAELGNIGAEQLGLSLASISELLFLSTVVVQAQFTQWRQAHGVALPDDGDKLLDLFAVSPVTLATIAGDCSADDIAKILSAASLSFGELSAVNPDYIHLDNPVWAKPFVNYREMFLLFSPETIYAWHSDQLACVARRAFKNPNARIGAARGRALEQLIDEHLKNLLPSAERLLSAKWTDPDTGRRYETDAICLIDGVAIIFEAKGDALSVQGRRGSQSWFDDLDDIVVKATEQASRLARLLLHPPVGGLELETVSGIRTIRWQEVNHVLRFGVALERTLTQSYGLATALRERLERLGVEPMPAVTIGDLNQLQALVPLEAARMHYLLRRSELERDCEFVADELDLIALYLRTGFAHLRDDSRRRLLIYGLSDFLRFYQKGTSYFDPHIPIPKRTTPLWDRLLAKVRHDWPHGWVEISYDLLNVGIDAQQRFEKDCFRARKRMRRKHLASTSEPAVMQAPKQLRPSLFICFPVTGGPLAPEAEHAQTEIEEFHLGERILTFSVAADGAKRFPELVRYRGRPWNAATSVREIDGDGIAPKFLFSAELAEESPHSFNELK
jgi:hypothetical protein